MNPFKKLAGQTAIYGLPTIVGRLLNYLLVPLYTRIFSTAEYGVVTELYAYVAFLFVILTYGMETAFFRFSNSGLDKQKVYGTTLFSVLTTSILFIVLIFFTRDNISESIGYANHTEYILWFAVILAADAISSIPYANLRLNNRAFNFALIKIVNIVTNIGLNLLFIVFIPYLIRTSPQSFITGIFQTIYDPSIGVGYIFISNLIASILTFVLLLPDMLKVSLKPDLKILVNMLKYGWPLLIFGMAGIINETFDRIILKYLLPPESDPMSQLGIYGACYKVSILMTLFIQTYRYAAEPFFFGHAASKDAKQTYAKLMHYFIIVCLFIYLAIMLNIDLVMLMIGPEFREGVQVVPILLWANLFLGVFYNLSVWFKLTDKTLLGAYISIAGAIITLVLNFVLIPGMGYVGAAWATFACYAGIMVLSWLVGQRFYPVNYDLKSAGFYTLVTLVIYLISLQTAHLSNVTEFIINALLLFCFLILVYFKEARAKLLGSIR